MGKFKEMPEQELWSARISFSACQEQFAELLLQTAEANDFTFFGFFVLNETDGRPEAFHFTRYPRPEYQNRRRQDCERALMTLQENLEKAEILILAGVEQAASYEPYRYRVILGLREGYDVNQLIRHSFNEAREFLGGNYQVKPAEMFAIGPERNYREPAVMILARGNDLAGIYLLAEKFKQERFILEDFAETSTRVVEFNTYE